MKPAIVLGLALAAKAMTADNELGITQQIAQMPFDQIAFDEVADDELGIKYVHLPSVPAPEYVAYDEVADDELAIKYVQLPVAEPVAFDEVADDELALPPFAKFDEVADDEFYAEEPQRENYQTHKQWIRALVHYRIMGKDDAADDELALPPIAKFDEVADDELGIKYVHLPIAEPVAFDDDENYVGFPQRDHFKSEQVWYEHLVKYQNSLKKADDDEFIAVNQPQKRPFEESKHAILCRNRPDHPWCGSAKKPLVQRLEADDEELFYVPGMRIQDIVHRDDVADDELAIKYVHLPSVPAPEYVAYDEVADDEFAIKYVHFPTAPAPEVVAYDEVADDEYYVPVVLVDDADDEFAINQQVIQLPEGHAFDDELNLMPVNPKFANIDWRKFAVNKPAVMPPMEALLRDDADDEMYVPVVLVDDADDELFANGMRIQDIARDAEDDELMVIPHPMPWVQTLVRDDEADDELVYLGQLIRDGGYIPRPYFDDEFRAEKSGKSSQEKTQKTEAPKNKRKFRPVVDETPVYQN